MIIQKEFTIPSLKRGFHIITDTVLNNLPKLPNTGVLHLFIKHSSAGLTINENADSDVQVDLASIFDNLVKEHQSYYTHTCEGSDDMPSHAKSSIVGYNLTIPITKGRLNLGIWQGIYLCEFRNHATKRNLVATIIGE